MTSTTRLRPQLRVARWLVSSVAAAILLLTPGPASADLFRASGILNTLLPGGSPWRGVDTAYNPGNDTYLVVTAFGPVLGVFTDGNGQPITAIFPIHTGTFGHMPRATYSPHAANGAGGFLVSWLDSDQGDSVRGRIVSLSAPSYLASGIATISAPGQGVAFFENRPAVAYSRSSQRFLVAWTTTQPSFGIQGRFVNADGAVISGLMRFEEGGSRDPGVAWNPATNEFGMVNTAFGGSGAFAAFRRIRASDGGVSARTSFGFTTGTFATGIDVTASNDYLVTWSLHPGTMSATFNQNGAQMTMNLVTFRLGFDLSMGLAFNPSVGTALVVSSDSQSYEIAGIEVSAGGVPVSSVAVLTEGASAKLSSFYPMAAARIGTNQWNVVRSHGFLGATNQIVATTGSSAPPPPAPAPPAPAPPTGGCTTPDPFASIGGGTCVNGGWIPGGASAPAPPPPAPAPPAPAPPPSGAGCTTPDPFTSIGGGTCRNGGWIPGGGGGAAPPPPAPPAPPPANSSCTTPDPFTSIGGGACINGGWMPIAIACTGPDPFTSIGGGLCINRGWVPRGSAP